MKSILILFIFINLSNFIISKFPDNRTRDDIEEIYSSKYLQFNCEPEKNKLYEKNSKQYAFPNTIRINNKGTLFISVPRHLFGDEIDSYIPGTINALIGDKLNPWPNEKENDFSKGRIHSIVGFEIDLDGNMYLLNHKKNKERELIIYYQNGTLKNSYDLDDVTKHKEHASFLSNIILDLTYNFAYISDTGKISKDDYVDDDEENNPKSNLIVLNLNNGVAIRYMNKHISTKPDINLKQTNKNLNINNIGLYGLALSCDKRFLYYSPVKSNKLYSVNTFHLQENKIIRNRDIFEYNKKTPAFEFISSARGLFYYTSIEENTILINFVERVLTFENLRSISHGEYFDINVPTSLTFNGTTGYLYYLVNRHNIFINDNLYTKLNTDENNFFIYKIKTNDRSYLYPCNILSYIPNSTWIFIISFAFLLSYLILRLIKYVVKLTPKEKEITENNEEELVYIHDEK